MIRVLVVDDHAVVRAGLTQVAEAAADIDVCCTAEDGEQAVAAAARERPDVVLMDLSMPGMGGIEATRRILAESPDARVVALTSFSDQPRILAALDAAVGYLLKDAEPAELLAGVRADARGESPLHPRAASAVLRARQSAHPAEELSQREREVLELAAKGLPNKLIARQLDVSEKTVKAHLTSIFRRIGVFADVRLVGHARVDVRLDPLDGARNPGQRRGAHLGARGAGERPLGPAVLLVERTARDRAAGARPASPAAAPERPSSTPRSRTRRSPRPRSPRRPRRRPRWRRRSPACRRCSPGLLSIGRQVTLTLVAVPRIPLRPR